MSDNLKVLIITGPVGSGKTSAAEAVYDKLSADKIPCAVIDFDWLTAAYPSPADDRFNFRLGIKNLSSILPNYLSIGIRLFIIPTVIETIDEINNFKVLFNGAEPFIVRLIAEPATLHKRLEKREIGIKKEQ